MIGLTEAETECGGDEKGVGIEDVEKPRNIRELSNRCGWPKWAVKI